MAEPLPKTAVPAVDERSRVERAAGEAAPAANRWGGLLDSSAGDVVAPNLASSGGAVTVRAGATDGIHGLVQLGTVAGATGVVPFQS